MAEHEGILTITIVEAKLSRETTYLGSMSPYLTLTFNGDKMKTEVSYGGGKTPTFGDEFTLECTNATDEITVRAWSQGMTSSDAVGFSKIKMSSLMMVPDDWHTIMFDNKPAGEIHIQTRWEPKSGEQDGAL